MASPDDLVGNPIDAAWDRALKLYRAPGFRAAYMKGARAAVAKRSLSTCPYPDTGRSWGAVYRKAWMNGYRSTLRA